MIERRCPPQQMCDEGNAYGLRAMPMVLVDGTIMWSPITQTGADVMRRIATPRVSGVVTSGLLELLVYPVIF